MGAKEAPYMRVHRGRQVAEEAVGCCCSLVPAPAENRVCPDAKPVHRNTCFSAAASHPSVMNYKTCRRAMTTNSLTWLVLQCITKTDCLRAICEIARHASLPVGVTVPANRATQIDTCLLLLLPATTT